MKTVIIVGGGAAGMLAGIAAARNGGTVHIFEKNEKLGKKVFITGKGRCNVTNACDTEDLFRNVVTNSKFLYSSFYGFNNFDSTSGGGGLSAEDREGKPGISGVRQVFGRD